MKTVVNLNSGVYYKGTYWNDLELVLEYMSENFTGDKKKWWITDFKERFATKPFRHALFINCGDGRFEREFIDSNIVSKVTAFDISKDLIEIAEKNRNDRNIKYKISDVNTITFLENEFDLIVNIAGLHHVQFIERLCVELAKSLENKGMFVNFDYIGPHRNQYPLRQWLLAKLLNTFLPENIKQNLHYPNLAAMLSADPTEAIHSDLIFDSISRYFNIFEKHDTGGGIAYLLLTQNTKLNKSSQEMLKPTVERILNWDRFFSSAKVVPQLFSYMIARPNKKALLESNKIKKHLMIEMDREKRSERLHGVYSLPDYLKLIYGSSGKRRKARLIMEGMKNFNLLLRDIYPKSLIEVLAPDRITF